MKRKRGERKKKRDEKMGITIVLNVNYFLSTHSYLKAICLYEQRRLCRHCVLGTKIIGCSYRSGAENLVSDIKPETTFSATEQLQKLRQNNFAAKYR